MRCIKKGKGLALSFFANSFSLLTLFSLIGWELSCINISGLLLLPESTVDWKIFMQ